MLLSTPGICEPITGISVFSHRFIQSTSDNSNLQGEIEKSSSYREFEANNRK